MTLALTALAAFLAGLVLAASMGILKARKLGRRLDAVHQQLRAFDGIEEELRILRESIRTVGEHHVANRRTETPMETLRAIDEVCTTWNQELKHLHKRLVSNLHALNRARQQQKELQNRVVQLDQMIVRTPDYDLRAQFAVLTKERDQLRVRLMQVNHLLTQGDGDATTRLLALSRQNESLRGELRSARKTIRSLERHAQVLEREEAEGKGVSVAKLLDADVPPGAFESLDTPMDDPVIAGGTVPPR